jgi:ribosome-binding protein aMBF1 (putative translation factor)
MGSLKRHKRRQQKRFNLLNNDDPNICKGERVMSDVEHYIEKRKKQNPHFAKDYESGYQTFEFSVMLREARERAGVTQESIAKKLRTKKSAISRIENHSEDIRLSTLHKYAKALGKRLRVQITE